MEYLFLLLGFAILVLSGRVLIACSTSIAKKLKLSPFIIGLTVVAAGTSAPEFLVSLTGALKGHTDLAIYNIIGSNISNILLVLAVSSIIFPIPVRIKTLRFDAPVLMGFTLLVWFIIRDLRFSATEGCLVFILLVLFVVLSVYRSRKDNGDDAGEEPPDLKTWIAVSGVLAASGGLALGADLLVENAIVIAEVFGLSQRIISVSMIAVGTSIPELTTSVIAAFRRQSDISIGNIIGSNIFNIGFVLGLTTMVRPMNVNPMVLSFDIYWFAGVAALLLLFFIIPQRLLISRWKGGAMLLLYLVYLYLILN